MNNSSPLLFITGEDMGLSHSVNAGLKKCVRSGSVTGLSVMPCGKAFEEAVPFINRCEVPVAAHLCMTFEKSVLSSAEVPSLVNREGNFPSGYCEFITKWFTGRINRDELREELDAQVRCLLDNDITVSGINSHEHLHLLPGIFSIVRELAGDYEIPYLRTIRPLEPDGRWPSSPPAWILRGLSEYQSWSRNENFTTNDYFLGFPSSTAGFIETADHFLQDSCAEHIEWGVHVCDGATPGKDHSLRGDDFWINSEVFADCAERLQLEEFGVRLGTFRDAMNDGS